MDPASGSAHSDYGSARVRYQHPGGGRGYTTAREIGTLSLPPGTQFEILSSSGSVIDNGVVGELRTEKQEASARRRESSQREYAAQRAREQAQAHAEALARAYDRLGHAKNTLDFWSQRLSEEQARLARELEALNEKLRFREGAYHAVNVSLSVVGFAAAVFLSGGVALVVGVVVIGAKQINEDQRIVPADPQTTSSALSSGADYGGLATSGADTAAQALGYTKEAAFRGAMGAAGRGLAGFSVGVDVYRAFTRDPQQFQYDVVGPAELDKLAADLEAIGLHESGDAWVAAKANADAQQSFNEALEAFTKAMQAVIDRESTHSAPR